MFSYLKKLEPTGTAEYRVKFVTLPDGSHPVLVVRPATTTGNKDYANGALRQANVSTSRKKKKKTEEDVVTFKVLAENRVLDRGLYHRHVLVGWKGMIDIVDGEPVELDYTPELGKAFLDELPDHLFDELREWCANPANFSEEDELNLENLAGNS